MYIESWLVLIRQNRILLQEWVFEGEEETSEHLDVFSDDQIGDLMLPLTTSRNGQAVPMDHRKRLKTGDLITVLINRRQEEAAESWLRLNKFNFLNTLETDQDLKK